MNEESVYWLFSSSAQSIATFVAFLLAGFTIVLQLMDAAEDRDETLQPIHDELKRRYHRNIVYLCVLTGLSIISSLGMTYLNGLKLPWIGWPSLAVFSLNVLVIYWGIRFVTLIIDPAKYGKAADEMFVEASKRLSLTGEQANKAAFFNVFVDLEKELRQFIDKEDLAERLLERPHAVYSFRQMIDLLRRNDLLDEGLYQRLQEINKMRNLIFHGSKETVDAEFIDMVSNVHNQLRPLFGKRKKSSRLTRRSS